MKNLVNEVNTLLSALSNDPEWNDMTDCVTDAFEDCAEYVKLVVRQESMIQNARFRMDPPEFRAYVMNLDMTRRTMHDGLMSSINLVNRLANKVGLPPIAPNVDENRRETYFDFAKRVVDEYYTNGPTGSVSES